MTTTPVKLCSFCGQPIASTTCETPKCVEASARVSTAPCDSRGVPLTRKGWCSQPEGKRTRRAHQMRMLESAYDRIRRAAAREQLTLADYVERWALSLPVD